MNAKARKRSTNGPDLSSAAKRAGEHEDRILRKAISGECTKAPVDFEADRRRRLTAAALNDALGRKRCAECATVGAWKVYDQNPSQPRVRYVKCLACGRADRVFLRPNE